eukprot:scaffold389039_cov17-Prasinocladus_malaysianus.AAC.1
MLFSESAHHMSANCKSQHYTYAILNNSVATSRKIVKWANQDEGYYVHYDLRALQVAIFKPEIAGVPDFQKQTCDFFDKLASMFQ